MLSMLVVAFVLAVVGTGVEFMRAAFALRAARVRCGLVLTDRNPLDPAVLSQDWKSLVSIFHHAADPDTERARRRVVRAGGTWLALMVVMMIAAITVVLVHGPS